jgi:hypothetical protein
VGSSRSTTTFRRAITEYPEGAEVGEDVAAVGLRIRHWEENCGTGPVVMIAMDIVKK